eukprot:3769428-Amphidinium_carterae.1
MPRQLDLFVHWTKAQIFARNRGNIEQKDNAIVCLATQFAGLCVGEWLSRQTCASVQVVKFLFRLLLTVRRPFELVSTLVAVQERPIHAVADVHTTKCQSDWLGDTQHIAQEPQPTTFNLPVHFTQYWLYILV